MILQAKNISKSFHFPVTTPLFHDISLTLSAGESMAITGKSGSGKTTLLHILGTLEAPDSGEIWIANTLFSKSKGPKIRNQHIGFIFQSYNLLEDFSTLENVLMPSWIARKPASKAYGLYLLEQVGLVDRANFPTKLLSGGERQRVAIARALCNDPDLILADEPTGNLDQANSEAIGELLLNLVETKKKGLILVTHDEALASLCQKKYSLAGGSLILQKPQILSTLSSVR
ncbi:MAG TPA: ABC transporter ATP-binding protein [Chlamydiales bacterium]|nr:ABC transporter ATP-binding protein [Chlamydiales bacterium]